MYWKMWMWNKGETVYSASIYCPVDELKRLCALVISTYEGITGGRCRDIRSYSHVCEFETKKLDRQENSVDFALLPNLVPKLYALWSEYRMTECPSGHVTFSFLSCEPASDCGAELHPTTCTARHGRQSVFTREKQRDVDSEFLMVTVNMIQCVVGTITVPYSLVCDYVHHCPDGSDENFCNHGVHCDEFACKNGQCATFSQRCDTVHDCLDRTDEQDCPFPIIRMNELIIQWLPPPTIINFDGRGSFTQQPMQESDQCPETHFPCSSVVKSHCLPVYVRCNGVYDCPGHEDEEACDRYTCPGFYRCRESSVCVHVNHTCDGWPQCPQSDDELYCKLTCPPGCLCQGLALVCPVTFPASEYLQTRYLDASRSHMKPADLFDNTYLVWLSLASCGIDLVVDLTWTNLIYLDLSHNSLTAVNMTRFFNLRNLKTLILAGNPLVSLVGGLSCLKYKVMKSLDLSTTLMRTFDSQPLSCFTRLVKLNVSHCPLQEIADNGFKSTPGLMTLDLSGSPVRKFPPDIFKELNQLKRIFAANYKLCCKSVLPDAFDERLCFAPQNEISSCDDLLKFNLFRAFMWIFTALGLLGNIGCFIIRVLSSNKRLTSGFNIFVTNLCVADFLMGVYLVTVGVADEIYRGQYVWYEESWKNSTACSVAGFLSLLSSEMSAFFILLITLDRFIVLTFPFTTVRFKGRSAALTCGLLWIPGVCLASVPLFPMTPRWELYGRTGICIPLPVIRGNFAGYHYAFGVMIILNFVIFLMIAVGQLSIYRSVRINSVMSDNSRKSQDFVIARRLFLVAASDFLCWFPIGLLGLMSSNGVPVSSDVNVAMAIFVLPFNSALNPFLYTINMVLEKRTKAREVQMIKMLENRILAQKEATA